jgi:hypothetical protein
MIMFGQSTILLAKGGYISSSEAMCKKGGNYVLFRVHGFYSRSGLPGQRGGSLGIPSGLVPCGSKVNYVQELYGIWLLFSLSF